MLPLSRRLVDNTEAKKRPFLHIRKRSPPLPPAALVSPKVVADSYRADHTGVTLETFLLSLRCVKGTLNHAMTHYNPLVLLSSKPNPSTSPFCSFFILSRTSNAGFPPYNWYPAALLPEPSSSTLVEMGALPRNRMRMSTMPRLQSRYPRFSCLHCSGRVSDRGGDRHSRGVWRSTMMQSEFWRHAANAAPGNNKT